MRLILFDFDYTLGDSTEGIVKSVNYSLERLGYEKCSSDIIQKTIGLSLEETLNSLVNCCSESEKKLFKKYFIQMANMVMVESALVYDGVAEWLALLNSIGLKIGVFSTKFRYMLSDILKKNGLLNLVDIIIGGEDVIEVKPSPEGIYKAAQITRIDCSDILYVGDNIVDSMAALAAGVEFVAVLTGTTPKKEFEVYPHIAITNTVCEACSFIYNKHMVT